MLYCGRVRLSCNKRKYICKTTTTAKKNAFSRKEALKYLYKGVTQNKKKLNNTYISETPQTNVNAAQSTKCVKIVMPKQLGHVINVKNQVFFKVLYLKTGSIVTVATT